MLLFQAVSILAEGAIISTILSTILNTHYSTMEPENSDINKMWVHAIKAK